MARISNRNFSYRFYIWGLFEEFTYDPSYYYVSEGMQEPLKYVGDRAKVKMIVPFKRGAYNDQSNGQPVYYEILEYIFEENL